MAPTAAAPVATTPVSIITVSRSDYARFATATARDAAELPRGAQRQSLEARASRATTKMRAACRLAGVPPVQAGLPGVAVPAPEDPDLARPQPVADMREPAPADGGR